VTGSAGFEDGLFTNADGLQVSYRIHAAQGTESGPPVFCLHGLTRNLIANMVMGVSTGYEKTLQISGVGYKAALHGSSLLLNLGFSHPVVYPVPEGIKATVDPKQNSITLKGIDKQLVGQVAATIRGIKKPEPYKGKGIKYSTETIKMKEGKAGKGKK